MAEITCPKCHATFTISEEEYKSIRMQLRDQEFVTALHEREQAFEQSKLDAVKIAEAAIVARAQRTIAEKDAKLAELAARIQANKTEQDFAVQKAVAKKDDELTQKVIEIEQLKGQIDSKTKEAELAQNNLKASYEQQLKFKDEEIERYKDFKAKQSTKMIGESLEVFCKNEFDKMRPVGFQNATFEKDNKISESGSKGDFIFRETEEGVEFISIMFEMKNEMDTTATKHKNEDFFKELDKDRKEKKCEYAVLVTLLEPENDLYNNGIVDVSYKYEKMYVVRPQFFIPIITLLRNAARNSLKYRKELAVVQNQNIDITNFEEKLNGFKEKFDRDCRLADKNFEDAINDIDKTIKNLEKIKKELQLTVSHLKLADNKLQDITIKKLVRGNPTMAAKFAELKTEAPDEE